MCIIAYKTAEAKFPDKAVLQTCFDNNPDGAGIMLAFNNQVYINKGLMTFKAFWKTLKGLRKRYGEDIPYVMHFRISTQAGTRADCTHPFPLSSKMEDLRTLNTTANIGIAHNGIITLTSNGYSKTITYNDTMAFVTDYLSLIIRSRNYYKDAKTLQLIAKLAGSKLAILDGAGHCELIGNGWIEDGGMKYSNSTYQKARYSAKWDDYSAYDYRWGDYEWDAENKTYKVKARKSSEDGYYDIYNHIIDQAWNGSTGKYDFTPGECPLDLDGDDSYCEECSNREKCDMWTYENYSNETNRT